MHVSAMHHSVAASSVRHFRSIDLRPLRPVFAHRQAENSLCYASDNRAKAVQTRKRLEYDNGAPLDRRSQAPVAMGRYQVSMISEWNVLTRVFPPFAQK